MVDYENVPICPICEQECSTIYTDINGDIVGCDECIGVADAEDVEECFPDEDDRDVVNEWRIPMEDY